MQKQKARTAKPAAPTATATASPATASPVPFDLKSREVPPPESRVREFEGEYFVIAIGKHFPPSAMAPALKYAAPYGKTTTAIQDAAMFDSWRDAMEYALDNLHFPEIPYPTPRGMEKPLFPRVCHVRIWTEITDC